MSALPRFDDYVPDSKPSPAQIDAEAERIDRDTEQVIELFADNAAWLTHQNKGNGHIELIELSVLLMNAWPVIEKRIAGIPVTPDEAMAIPTLFRAMRPLIDERAVLVREAAEDACRVHL